jgi:hypothetical protein
MSAYVIQIKAPGARQEDILRGQIAAAIVFCVRGVEPLQAAEADILQALVRDDLDLTDVERRNADVWREALQAGVTTACAGLPEWPAGWNFWLEEVDAMGYAVSLLGSEGQGWRRR